jgi:hypothetical protein
VAAALPAWVAISAGFATVTLAVAFDSLVLVHITRAVVFAGTLHRFMPPYDRDLRLELDLAL